MIVSGKVLTINGEVNISDLSIGDIVLTNKNRRVEVIDIEEVKVDRVCKFKKNTELIVTDDCVLSTAYGIKKVIEMKDSGVVYFLKSSGKIEKEEWVKEIMNVVSYRIRFSNECIIYVSGYSVKMGV